MFTGDATKNNSLKIISKLLAVCRSLLLLTVLGLEPSRSVRGSFNEGCTLSIGVSADSPKITHAYISETQLLPAFASRTGCLLLWAGQWRSTYLSQAESLTKPQCFSKPNNLFTREPWQVLMGGLSGLLAFQRKINDQRRRICHNREASDFHLCWRFASRWRWRQTASSQLFLQGHRNSTDMNQSQITSLMAVAPVPPQLLPPTHVLPCFCVVVLQFVAAKQLKSQTLFLEVLELLRLDAALIHPRTNSRVTESNKTKQTLCF